MSVKIRLTRFGRKKRPFYRIVVTDTRSPRDGRYLECLGTYEALTNPSAVKVEESRVNYWLDKGAVPSDTVRSLLKHKGILVRRNLKKRGFDETGIEEEVKKWEAVQADRSKRAGEKTRVSKKAREKAAKAAEAKPEAAAPAAESQASAPAA
ncbi:30S ribosomal protein S16 [bacterium]|nr:30S ribosomal protein S16 [bacterium]